MAISFRWTSAIIAIALISWLWVTLSGTAQDHWISRYVTDRRQTSYPSLQTLDWRRHTRLASTKTRRHNSLVEQGNISRIAHVPTTSDIEAQDTQRVRSSLELKLTFLPIVCIITWAMRHAYRHVANAGFEPRFLMLTTDGVGDVEDMNTTPASASSPTLNTKPVWAKLPKSSQSRFPPPELQRAKERLIQSQTMSAKNGIMQVQEDYPQHYLNTITFSMGLASTATFFDIGISEALCNALYEVGYRKPTPIQRYAYPEIIKGHDVVVASESGTGKTLAWLVPVIERILKAFATDGSRIRAMVLVPNQPIGTQTMRVIQRVLSKLSSPCPVAASEIMQEMETDWHANIFVGTPRAVRRHMSEVEEDPLDIIVLEEADFMLWGGYSVAQWMEEIRCRAKFEYRLSGRLVQPQTILVGSTFVNRGDANLIEVISSSWPAAVWVRSRTLHQTLPTLRYRFLHVDDFTRMRTLLLAIEETTQMPGSRTLVFVNSAASMEEVHMALSHAGFRCSKFSVATPFEQRELLLQQLASRQLEILVCTDLAARGLDIPQLTHVIEYEFAPNAVVHLHRVGRVARCGREGFSTSLYDASQAPLVAEIRQANDDHRTLERAFTRTGGGFVKLSTRARLERELQMRLEEEYMTANAEQLEKEAAWLQRVAEAKKSSPPSYIDDIDEEMDLLSKPFPVVSKRSSVDGH